MKKCGALLVALIAATQAQAQNDPTSAKTFYPSCLAAADIVQGKRPAANSEEAAMQLRKAAICFGAVTAIMNVEPFFKPEFAACPPPDGKRSANQAILVVAAYLKSHSERLNENFHSQAVGALAAAFPCPK